MKPLMTKAGLITAQGFACGYVQKSREGVTIEKRGLGYLVRADHGHSVIRLGPGLGRARKAWREARALVRAFDRAKGWRVRLVWNGTGQESRVELVEPGGRFSGPYESEHDARLAWASRTNWE